MATAGLGHEALHALCGLFCLATGDGGDGISLADPTKGLVVQRTRSDRVVVGWSAHGYG